jgi:hydrogenase maturation protease
MQKKTAIMGFGNPVRSDDGIGPYVIEQLQKRLANQYDFADEDASLQLFDMGTSAFEVLFKLRGREQILLVDAVLNTGEPVGTLYRVPAEEVERAPDNEPLVFLHSLKWDQALAYARRILGEAYPRDIQVYLIAIDDTRLEIQLSPEAKAAGDRVVELILAEVGELVIDGR